MKSFYLLFLAATLLLVSCNSENAWNCVQTTGTIQTDTIVVPEFEKITVLHRSQLIVKTGDEPQVLLKTGKNLKNDVNISVVNGTLLIDNTNACNTIRDYGVTQVIVTTHTLTEIRNASGLPVLSEGVLDFPNLTLRSDDLVEEDFYHKTGDFELSLNCTNLKIETNGKSNFYLDGFAKNTEINFLDGDNRCECNLLKMDTAQIFHRGTNDIFIAPNQSVTGELRSIGNLVLSQQVPVMEVKSFYTGKVIIRSKSD